MKALGYLFRTTIKNRIKQLRKNPGQLVLVILFVVMMGMVLFSAAISKNEPQDFHPMAELEALVLALYAVMFVMVCMSGLSSGASFYSMADVNLLFATPIPQQKILFYGLLRQLGTSVLLGFFLLFQYTWLHNMYNLSFVGLLAILLGYCLNVFCAQLTSMVIYSFTSGNDSRRHTVKVALVGLCALAGAAVAIPVLHVWNSPTDWPMKEFYTDARMGAAVSAGNSWLLALFPVAGWLKIAVSGIFEGALMSVLLGLGAVAAYVVALVALITKTHPDFYEDVLKATEVSFSAITAAKQGKMAEAVPANVKVGKTGIGSGSGAGVFFYKHRLESRRSRLFVLDTMTLVWAGICIVFALFMRGEGIVPVFVFATYIQIFSSSMGRWLRELIMPYVYMIPVSPFRKLVGVCRESICKAAAEAIVVIVPVGLIVAASPLEIVVCVIARFSFALLFMAGNILVERLFGQVVSKALIIGVFFLSMIILALPGVVVGAILGAASGSIFATMLVIVAWNVAVALLIAFLCRDILNYAELNNR